MKMTTKSWSSPSLRSETAVGPNGEVTTRAALLANDKWGIISQGGGISAAPTAVAKGVSSSDGGGGERP